MRIVNVHERTYDASPERVGALIDSLGGAGDRLWPRRHWPPMVLGGGVVVGSSGGHGPIRYTVHDHDPGRAVVFRFTRPRGWSGTHRFTVAAVGDGARLSHVLEMEATGLGLLFWLGIFRPLHDALIEDALDRAAVELGAGVASGGAPGGSTAPEWSRRVRLLRWALSPRRRVAPGR